MALQEAASNDNTKGRDMDDCGQTAFEAPPARRKSLGFLFALGVLVALAGSPAESQAQNQAPNQAPGVNPRPTLQPTGEKIGDWDLVCTVPNAAAAGTQPEACFITQQFLDPNSGRPILKITIGYFGNNRSTAGAVIAMPLGIPLSRGVQIGVDGRPVSTVPFQFCRRDGCQAFVEMNDTIVNAFKAGNQGATTVRSGENEALNMPFSLSGFTAGFARIK